MLTGGTLRQPSVDDGNDPPAIVSSEQAPTIDDGIEAHRACVGFCAGFCAVLTREWRVSRVIPWRFESCAAHYLFVHYSCFVGRNRDNSRRSIGFHSVLRFFAARCGSLLRLILRCRCVEFCAGFYVGFSAGMYDWARVTLVICDPASMLVRLHRLP